MPAKKTLPYGEWTSPVTTARVVAGQMRYGGLALDGESVYWIEGRPAEGGRNVIVRHDPDGSRRDLTPAPFNVRSRVHEYGGGPFAVHDGTLWFVNFADQRVYRQAPGAKPRPLTEHGPWRFADLVLDPARERLICVREDHGEGHAEPRNALVAVDLDGGEVEVLAQGHDFYASPALAPGGGRLAFLAWDHPCMPWDGTVLYAADVHARGGLGPIGAVAGSAQESVFQPLWSPDGLLYFVSDRSGWWNLYRWQDRCVLAVHTEAADMGLAQWQFAMATYGFADAGTVILARCDRGRWQLARLDVASGELAPYQTSFTGFDMLRVGSGGAVFVGATAEQPPAVARVALADGAGCVLSAPGETALDAADVSHPEPVEFPTAGGERAHGFYYPPASARFRGPGGERPPLIVISHGGPTSATGAGFDLRVQFWTTRGFAVLDVNYRGSTGYGRAYRRALDGRWGVADVEDCVHGARFLAESGRADPARLIIRGSSAGGYTTLAALTFHDTFRAGASYYGISDLEILARDTHKFESRYLDGLVGPYPERRDRYRERSPIHHSERLACPVIFFQGLEDAVVPPSQAEMMVAALRGKGLPVAYLAFEGEQHGFRRADTIARALEAELYFYGRVLDFEPAGELAPVEIENL